MFYWFREINALINENENENQKIKKIFKKVKKLTNSEILILNCQISQKFLTFWGQKFSYREFWKKIPTQ